MIMSNSKLMGLFKLMVLSVFMSIFSVAAVKAQCPIIQFEDLRDVIGFPQFDNTSQCGDADTLSLVVFTDAPGQNLAGIPPSHMRVVLRQVQSFL